MKFKILFVSLCFLSLNLNAQSNDGRVQMRSVGTKSASASGFVVGLVYSNLSDGSSKSSRQTYLNDAKSSDTSETDKSGIHIGLYGLNLGYKNIYAFGSFGYSVGVQALRGLNGREFPSKLNIYKVLGDMILPMNDVFSLSGGINLSYFDGLTEGANKVDPGLGVQAGVEVRFSQLSVLVGSQVLSLTQKYSYSGSFNGNNFRSEDKSETLVSGVITQVSYTF